MTRRDQGETSTSEQNRSRGNNNIQNVLHVAKSNCIHFHKLSFFSLILTAPFFKLLLPLPSGFRFLLVVQSISKQTKKISQSTVTGNRFLPSSPKQFQRFFTKFLRIVIYLSVCFFLFFPPVRGASRLTAITSP